MTVPSILIADDESSLRVLLSEVMQREGYDVDTAVNGEEAVQKVRERDFDAVVMDVRMPKVDGIQALREMKRVNPALTVVMITALENREIALEAVKQGAYDFFNKPFELAEIRVVVRRAVERRQLVRQISTLESKLLDRLSFERIIGHSESMKEVYDLIGRVVTNDVTVLITGESGTGKELVAQAIHYHSPRRSRPFVSINCAAIPEALLESEMFGHERGAFTGAVAAKAGKIEAAEGGTVFMDEVGDMPLPLQSKLLRALQEREIVRVGANKPVKVDIRIIAATNQNLEAMVAARSFREDLYFRLNVLPIRIPPLRERRTDIPMLVAHFIGMYNPRLNRSMQGIEDDALSALERYHWPGNVRELENAIQRAMVMSPGAMVTLEGLPANIRSAPGAPLAPAGEAIHGFDSAMLEDFTVPLQDKVERLAEQIEVRLITAALHKANFHRQATADLLGISRKSLHNKMARYGLFGGRAESTESDL
jgi:DNA-binding NtrC family response regulator